MFLRRKTKSMRGVGYSYWHLCETVRTARGPRQRVVASLGKLDQKQCAGFSGGWGDLPALLRGERLPPKPVTTALPGFDTGDSSEPARWEQADLRALRVERPRVCQQNQEHRSASRRTGRRAQRASNILKRFLFVGIRSDF